MSFAPTFDFSASPTLCGFLRDQTSLVRVLIGPRGSGKSTASSVEIMRIAAMQTPDQDGIRRSRFAVVRNTSPELKSTTIKTWQRLWPPDKVGSDVRFTSPIGHRIQVEPHGGQAGLDVEVLFVPLDRPQDVKKLLSMELTAAWINEAREVPREIVQQLRACIRRYPSPESVVRPCIWLDTNPPDEDHWLSQLARYERPEGWAFYHQPPAVLEVEPEAHGYRCVDVERKGELFDEAHPGGGRWWVVNPAAENMQPGMDAYYVDQLSGARLEWIRVYLQARYGYVAEGKPVVPEYNDQLMARPMEALEEQPLLLGFDVGGGTLQPAAVVAQLHPRGTWMILAELVCAKDTPIGEAGVHRFSDLLRQMLAQTFPQHFKRGMIEVAWGDPAGVKRDELFEVAVFDHLRSRGVPAQPAPSQDVRLRIEAVAAPMNRMIDGVPGLLVHERCSYLRKGLAGGWHYRRVQIAGEERYHDEPYKNLYSHPCDALGYLLLGGGEHRKLTRGSSRPSAVQGEVEFDVFA